MEAAPGTVAQVRACAHELVRFAKKSGSVVILVGHVTKDGQIAGPRVVEHLVDAVIYFEGERGLPFRILRAVKNRFGATDEIGVFEMVDQGLVETPNPSALFLGGSGERPSGAAVFAGVEGSRPVLVEIQALAAPTAYGTPRRAVVGWDSARLAMILAVLETRCGLSFSGRDVYLSVAGGLRITEPAADLAVAAALISSLADQRAACAVRGVWRGGAFGGGAPGGAERFAAEGSGETGFRARVRARAEEEWRGRRSKGARSGAYRGACGGAGRGALIWSAGVSPAARVVRHALRCSWPDRGCRRDAGGPYSS